MPFLLLFADNCPAAFNFPLDLPVSTYKYHVTVVTSDSVEQVVTLGQGGTLISAREFEKEMEIVVKFLIPYLSYDIRKP